MAKKIFGADQNKKGTNSGSVDQQNPPESLSPEQTQSPEVNQPPIPPKSGKSLFKILTGNDGSFESVHKINGVKFDVICVKGVISTDDPVLAESLKKIFTPPPPKPKSKFRY
jgi:hypothetical protein